MIGIWKKLGFLKLGKSALLFLLIICSGALWAQYPAGYFYIIFRGETLCVRPVIVDAATEEEWFNYTGFSCHTGFETAYETHYFFFYNPTTGNMGLIIQHNVADSGTEYCTSSLYLDGLPAGCTFAMSDGPNHPHPGSIGRPCGSPQEFDLDCYPQGGWSWRTETDGGAFYCPREEFEFSMRSIYGGDDIIQRLYFLSGDAGEDRIFLKYIWADDEDTVIVGHDFQGLLDIPYINEFCVALESQDTIRIPVCNNDETSDTFNFGAITPPSSPPFTLIYAPTMLAPGECDEIRFILDASVMGSFSDFLTIDLSTPCDSYRTAIINYEVVRGGLYPVWFWEETECDSVNLVTICYDYEECDSAFIQAWIMDESLIWVDAGTGWFSTLFNTEGNLWTGVEPGEHCFQWLMSEDYPGHEQCEIGIRIVAYDSLGDSVSSEIFGCLDSDPPEITIDCPEIVFADSQYTFEWTVEDMFLEDSTADIHIFGCGINEYYTVSGTQLDWLTPNMPCFSCTLIITARDSFCNIGADTCIFEIVCVPELDSLWFWEETVCDSQNIVEICYTLLSCDSIPYNVMVNLFADTGVLWEISLDSIYDYGSDIGDEIYPDTHCFFWLMSADLPDSEGCDFTVQVLLEGEYPDTLIMTDCLDSDPPEITIDCPEIVFADSQYTFEWTVEDMFWTDGISEIHIFGCGIDEYFTAGATHFDWTAPNMPCQSCTLIITARDSFCNIGADTCIFEIVCVPELDLLWFWEETVCDSQNIVEICYTLWSCDSIPYTVTVNLFADTNMLWEIPLDSIYDYGGDIGDEIYPDTHCFFWAMSADLPDSEGCDFTVQVTLEEEDYPDTLSITDCLDSDPPDVVIECPEFIAADSLYRFFWTVEDMFLLHGNYELHFFGCGIDEFYIVSDLNFFWAPPNISCPSCTLVITARDSFCNIGVDTCIFELKCLPVLQAVWFWEETECDSQNVVEICYILNCCDSLPFTVTVDMFADFLMAENIPLTTITDEEGDFGDSVYPGTHCFNWFMNIDFPDSESCVFNILVMLEGEYPDTLTRIGCLDSHHPEVEIDCPSILSAGDLYTFNWTVEDFFWLNNLCVLYIFGCGSDEEHAVTGNDFEWAIPMVSCPSCTLIVEVRDSFCNIGADTCVFELECLPHISNFHFDEETDCNEQNIVEFCYDLISCDSLPYNISVELFADSALSANIPLLTLFNHAGDIGGNVYPGTHCFNWVMSDDYPDSESCGFAAQVTLAGANPDTVLAYNCLDSRPPLVVLQCPENWIHNTGDSIRLNWSIEDMFQREDPCTIEIISHVGRNIFIVPDTTMLWEIPRSCDSIVLRIAVRDSFCNWGHDTCTFIACSRLETWLDCAPCDFFSSCSTQTVSIWALDTACGFKLDTTAVFADCIIRHSDGSIDYFGAEIFRYEIFGDSTYIIIDDLLFIDGDEFFISLDSIFSDQGCKTIPREE